jgi:membrane dipeptidase
MKKIVSTLLLLWLLSPAEAREPVASQKAIKINQDSLVFDAHSDTVLRLVREDIDLGKRLDAGHIDIPRMKEGGLNVQVFAMWVETKHWPDHATHRALQMTDAILRAIGKYPDHIDLALTVKDVRRLYAEGKIAVFLGVEGGHAIEDDLATLRMFHRLGVRLMTITWSKNTNWADASSDKPKHNGLTDFGKQVIREMNRLGMVIDLSHASVKTFYDVLKLTTKPVIASHSCCKAICNHDRNLTDDQIRALAKNGGVLAINYLPAFLDQETSEKMPKVWDEAGVLWKKHKNDMKTYRRLRNQLYAKRTKNFPKVTIKKLVDHMDHVVKLVGPDHVGLGSDFDGISRTPIDLKDASHLPRITDELLKRGYTEKDIKKILGGNLLRVFEQAIGE